MIERLLSTLGMRMVPYLNLLVVPIMGLTSDSAPAVRASATSAFAAAVALLPLALVCLSFGDCWHVVGVGIVLLLWHEKE